MGLQWQIKSILFGCYKIGFNIISSDDIQASFNGMDAGTIIQIKNNITKLITKISKVFGQHAYPGRLVVIGGPLPRIQAFVIIQNQLQTSIAILPQKLSYNRATNSNVEVANLANGQIVG